MTGLGAARESYARLGIDPRPSRFANDGRDYAAWAARADRFMADDGTAAVVCTCSTVTGTLCAGHAAMSQGRTPTHAEFDASRRTA